MMKPLDREVVCWEGAPASDDIRREFARLGMRVADLPAEPDARKAAARQARSVVFNVGQSVGRAVSEVISVAPELINCGALPIILVPSPLANSASIQVSGAGLGGRVAVLSATRAMDAALRSFQHECGFPVLGEGPVIEGADLPEDLRVLFLRAFWDCSLIRLEPMVEGTASVFKVYAVVSSGGALQRPLPFFVKATTSKKILFEKDNYARNVSAFLPFYLRPNLDERRCVVGSEQALLVGNFVEHTLSLRDALELDAPRTLLSSLFDQTLRAWRLPSSGPGEGGTLVSVARSMRSLFRTDIRTARVESALSLGAVRRPPEIKRLLRGATPVWVDLVRSHNDLHTGNVLVRGTDAVLIDFFATDLAPSAADPAGLEVSIFFTPPRGAGVFDREAWRTLADKLYNADAVLRVPPPAAEPTRREWLWGAVRQLRMVALAGCRDPLEYKIALAIHLLRFSVFRARSEDEEFCRTYAYVACDRIVGSLPQVAVPAMPTAGAIAIENTESEQPDGSQPVD